MIIGFSNCYFAISFPKPENLTQLGLQNQFQLCARFRVKKWYAHSSKNQKCFWLLIHKKKPFQKSRKRHFTDISINFLCKSAEYCVILHLIYLNMSTRYWMKKSHLLIFWSFYSNAIFYKAYIPGYFIMLCLSCLIILIFSISIFLHLG